LRSAAHYRRVGAENELNPRPRAADKTRMDSIDATPAPDGADRRRAARQAIITKALVVREREGGQPQRATLADVSLLGLSFDFPEQLEVGSRLRVRVEAGPMRMSARVRVASCRPIENGYRVGCELVLNEVEPIDRTQPRETEVRPKPVALPRNPCYELRPIPAVRS
jgi:hypothetical protein